MKFSEAAADASHKLTFSQRFNVRAPTRHALDSRVADFLQWSGELSLQDIPCTPGAIHGRTHLERGAGRRGTVDTGSRSPPPSHASESSSWRTAARPRRAGRDPNNGSQSGGREARGLARKVELQRSHVLRSLPGAVDRVEGVGRHSISNETRCSILRNRSGDGMDLNELQVRPGHMSALSTTRYSRHVRYLAELHKVPAALARWAELMETVLTSGRSHSIHTRTSTFEVLG